MPYAFHRAYFFNKEFLGRAATLRVHPVKQLPVFRVPSGYSRLRYAPVLSTAPSSHLCYPSRAQRLSKTVLIISELFNIFPFYLSLNCIRFEAEKIQIMSQKNILTREAAAEKLQRMALQIAENIGEDKEDLILIGIDVNGSHIARKIKSYVQQYYAGNIEFISLSLDKKNPTEISLSKSLDFNNKNIILTDDVVNSGKTFLYALKPLLDFHPKRIQTLTIIERMHKHFPVKADYVGLSVATTATDNIKVLFEEDDIVGAILTQ
ncbi:MAG: phosphoribosyltransferase family protein [Arachidicoccus sp.]|nr:phosphoribosyltransferase family protein [Arachidicoccus sp.]